MLRRSLPFLLVATFAVDASAQTNAEAPKGPPVVDDATKALSKRSARKGRKAFGKGQYDQAVPHLVEAHRLWPLPHLRAEVAVAQAAAGQINEAWVTVQRAQADAYDDKTREATADAAEQLRAMFGETHGVLKVTSTPEVAKLVLTAGEDRLDAATPFERWMAAGRWTLATSAEGHKEQQAQITLAPGGEVHHEARLVSLQSIADDKAKIEADKKAKAEAIAAAKAAAQARRDKAEAARLAAIEARRQEAIEAERRIAWFVLGSGAAVVGGGVLVGAWAGQAEDDLTALKGGPHRRGEIDEAYDKANSTTRAANALLTVGVGVLAGGGWLLFTAGDGVTAAGTF